MCVDENSWNQTLCEKRTVVHEIGHQFELGHHSWCVMREFYDPSYTASSFCEDCVVKIRAIIEAP